MFRPMLLRMLCLLLCLFSAESLAQSKTFQNPLLVSAGADPHIVFHDGWYYMTYTTGRDIQIRKSRSLATLDHAETRVVFQPSGEASCCHVWAPEFHLLEGPSGKRWYLYFTAGPSNCCAEQRMHVAESVSEDPMGPYVLRGKIADPQHDFWAIDASVVQAKDRLYLVYSGTPEDHMPYEKPQRIYIAEMENPWTLKTGRVEISAPDLIWERIGGPVNEGPIALYHDNQIFLAFSGSGCWTDDYALGMLKASVDADLLNPVSWTKLPEPLLERNDAGQVYGPGHNGFFKSPDGTEDWVVYHANPAPGQQCGESRVARAQKITWDEQGLPVFGAAVPLWTDLPLPAGDPGAP